LCKPQAISITTSDRFSARQSQLVFDNPTSQKAWKNAREENFLVVPTESDWLEASRIQFLLAQERKKDAGGKSPRRTAKVKQELALDCLIAVSACRENITVVTNDSDFWAIKRYLKKLKLLQF